GVGTQITTVSACASSLASVVARNPAASIFAMSPSDRSSTCETPLLSPLTTSAEVSIPTTDIPARAAASASCSPTYPRPMTARSTAMGTPGGSVVDGQHGASYG